MPLYEYQCDACGHRFEVIQKFSDPPREACPRCGAAVRKLVSSPAFQFKGSGWYVTDYAKKSEAGKAEGKAEAAEAKDAGKDAKEGKESKEPAAKETPTKDTASKDSASATTSKT